jgi:hypothetical protein
MLLVVLPSQTPTGSIDLETHRAWVRSFPHTLDHPLLFKKVNGVVGRSDHFTGSGGVEGDFDADGDVDLHDYFAMSICQSFSGPGVDTPPACAIFDFDTDDDIDMQDVARFDEAFTASIGGIQVEAGNLRSVSASQDGYYSGEPGTNGNNALNGNRPSSGLLRVRPLV